MKDELQLAATTPATESTDYNLPKGKSDFQGLYDYDSYPHGFQNLRPLEDCLHSFLSERRKFAKYASRATKSMRGLFGNTGWAESGLIDDKRGPM
jgi:hypothetical protein